MPVPPPTSSGAGQSTALVVAAVSASVEHIEQVRASALMDRPDTLNLLAALVAVLVLVSLEVSVLA